MSRSYLESDFYKQQKELGQRMANESYLKSAPALMERKKEIKRQYDEQIAESKRLQAEARAYERSHGNSGNFFKDFKYGFKYGAKQASNVLKPFNKYVAPVISMAGPVGRGIAGATTATAGVLDRLT